MTSEIVWYGRLLVWIGALVLLAEALLGRSTAISTILGVLMLSAGFLAFLAGLATEGRSIRLPDTETEDASVVRTESPTEPQVAKAESLSEPVSDVSQSTAVSTQSRVVTFEASEGEAVACMRCGQVMNPGQVAARCPVCGSAHHGSCWVENHFHCSAPDCSGHGSLEAPDED